MSSPASDSCDPEALHGRLSALVDGELSAAELAELESQLLASPTARAEYREFMCVEALLAWSSTTGAEPAVPATDRPRRLVAPRAAVWLGLVATAALSAGLALVAWIPTVARPPSAVFLSAADDAVWHGSRPLAIGAAVGPGPLRLAAGSAQLTFPSGAVVALQAGAEIEVLGPNRLFLRGGRVSPFVPPQAKGFTVVSPGGQVVDYGTEFSIAVGGSGQTDVFVIDGEVGVTNGHAASSKEVRLTQGFGTQMSAVGADPVMTQRPLLIDHFDRPDGPLMRKDIDPGQESRVADGMLSIPIPRMAKMARLEIDHDFSSLVGRRSAISFRALLPNNGRVHLNRWLALVIDAGGGQPPMAFEPSAAAAVMMSPMWQAGVRIEGLPIVSKEFFPRGLGIEGPYQVVITIDDTPAGRARHGSAVVTVMINGLEFATEQPFQLGERPRLAFQTYVTTPSEADAVAVVDDFCVSVVVP